MAIDMSTGNADPSVGWDGYSYSLSHSIHFQIWYVFQSIQIQAFRLWAAKKNTICHVRWHAEIVARQGFYIEMSYNLNRDL